MTGTGRPGRKTQLDVRYTERAPIGTRAMNEAWDVNLLAEVKIEGDDVAVYVAGEIDAASAATLRRRMDDLIASTIGTIALDMRGVTFIDSKGIRALIEADRRVRAQRRSFVLRELSAQTQRALDRSGTRRIFDIAAEQ